MILTASAELAKKNIQKSMLGNLIFYHKSPKINNFLNKIFKKKVLVSNKKERKKWLNIWSKLWNSLFCWKASVDVIKKLPMTSLCGKWKEWLDGVVFTNLIIFFLWGALTLKVQPKSTDRFRDKVPPKVLWMPALVRSFFVLLIWIKI